RRPLAKRGQADRHHVEAVEEVFAEGALRDELLQIAVRRGDEADVDAHRLDAADALELALLQRAQEPPPHLDGGLAELDAEERAAVRELEAPRFAAHGAGERAALVAEELALDELLRDRRAIDLDEGLPASGRVIVQRAGDELLAGTALAGDEHRGRTVG